MDYKQLGANIKLKRIEKGMIQAKLAELVGISPVFMSQLETANKKPSVDTIYYIAKSLEVSIDELIDNTNSQYISERILGLVEKRTAEEKRFLFNSLECIMKELDKLLGKNVL